MLSVSCKLRKTLKVNNGVNLNNEDHILWVIEHTFYSIRPFLSTQMAINVRLILHLQAVNGNVQ